MLAYSIAPNDGRRKKECRWAPTHIQRQQKQKKNTGRAGCTGRTVWDYFALLAMTIVTLTATLPDFHRAPGPKRKSEWE